MSLKGRGRCLFAYLAAVFVVATLGLGAHAREPWHSRYDKISRDDGDYRKGEIYRVDLEDLRPTQFAVGMSEVKRRREDLREMGKHERRRYLRKKMGAVIIGPDRELWLIDGHHIARALALEGYDEMLVRLAADWSRMSRADFFKRMIRKEFVWLYDEEGRGPLDVRELPVKFNQLRNDIYRSLAYRVRKAGGFRDTTVPFAEFKWANYFRTRIAKEKVQRAPRQALEAALELAHDPEARGLPGYSGPRHCELLLFGK